VRSSDTGASHVIDGEIMIAGTDVTMFARLEDVARGATVWSQRVTVHADQLFSAEDVIAERVVEALRLRLAAGE
jgi:TolB-like protein